MKLQTKKVICLSIFVASILTIIGTISYAYFVAAVDVKSQQTAELTTGTMTVKFMDNDEGINKALNFGESITKKFTITNTGTLESSIKLNFVDLINTYTKGSLSYTLSYSETENGVYSEVVSETNMPVSATPTKATLAKKITLPVGATYYYNLVIKLNYLDDVNQDPDLNASFSTRFGAEDASIPSPIEKLAASSNGTKASFDNPATTDEGIFEMEDDYGTSYYYRGAVTNNYVKFGQNKSGQDMYWRIIRINGDGSLRIMYTGTQAYANGTNNSEMFIKTGQAWSSSSGDAKYVGWMYGGTKGTASTDKAQAQKNETNSDIKTVVDEWYKENIVDTGYSSAVADILFCNDRTTPGKDKTGWNSDTGLGYGTNKTAYGATSRTGIWNSSTTPSAPTFKCPEKNDSFTVDDTTKGNGDLTYPVGLITADEIVAAGSGKYGTTNNQYYLYRPSNWYCSLSPYNYTTSAYVFIVNASGRFYYHLVNVAGAVAPVINLSAEYSATLQGTGTTSDPYRAA